MNTQKCCNCKCTVLHGDAYPMNLSMYNVGEENFHWQRKFCLIKQGRHMINITLCDLCYKYLTCIKETGWNVVWPAYMWQYLCSYTSDQNAKQRWKFIPGLWRPWWRTNYRVLTGLFDIEEVVSFLLTEQMISKGSRQHWST